MYFCVPYVYVDGVGTSICIPLHIHHHLGIRSLHYVWGAFSAVKKRKKNNSLSQQLSFRVAKHSRTLAAGYPTPPLPCFRWTRCQGQNSVVSTKLW